MALSFFDALRRAYHTWIPVDVRRRLRLTRWTATRRALSRVWLRTGGCVAAGPFAGLRLLARTPADYESAVLLGSFECEIHSWLEQEFARGWSIAVNVGSAAGYYSTGMAMRLSRATVYAYEMDPTWREETRRSAEANGVGERVHPLGRADIEVLAALPVPAGLGALVICDCEGFERDLLDPVRIPWLAHSALCVELHDFAAPGATETLRARLGDTHELAIVEQQPRDAATWASRAGIDPADAAQMCDEIRAWGKIRVRGRWLLATPRSRTRTG